MWCSADLVPLIGLAHVALLGWLGWVFAAWRALRPPPVRLARLYMVIGAGSSIANFVIAATTTSGEEAVHALLAQLFGSFVILVAMYVEVFVRWLRVRHARDGFAYARVVGRTRSRRRLPAGP